MPRLMSEWHLCRLPPMDDFAHIEAEFQLFLACFHPQSFVFVFPDCGLQLRFSNFLEHPQNICNALTAGRHSPYHNSPEPGQTLHFSNWLKTWQKVALEEKNFTQKQGICLMKCICRGHASTSHRYPVEILKTTILIASGSEQSFSQKSFNSPICITCIVHYRILKQYEYFLYIALLLCFPTL